MKKKKKEKAAVTQSGKNEVPVHITEEQKKAVVEGGIDIGKPTMRPAIIQAYWVVLGIHILGPLTIIQHCTR